MKWLTWIISLQCDVQLGKLWVLAFMLRCTTHPNTVAGQVHPVMAMALPELRLWAVTVEGQLQHLPNIPTLSTFFWRRLLGYNVWTCRDGIPWTITDVSWHTARTDQESPKYFDKYRFSTIASTGSGLVLWLVQSWFNPWTFQELVYFPMGMRACSVTSFSQYIHIHFTALLGTIMELWNWFVYSPRE